MELCEFAGNIRKYPAIGPAKKSHTVYYRRKYRKIQLLPQIRL
jgi:hypothetical protein